MPKMPYNKPMLLTGASLLNSQGRSCTTPKTSPKNKINQLIIVLITGRYSVVQTVEAMSYLKFFDD